MQGRVLSLMALLCGCCPAAYAVTHHVRPAWTNVVPPYTNWFTAATTLQAAVSVATNGATVLVSNGLYREAAEIVVSNAILIRSVNGASVTAVDGGGGHRCFTLRTNATLEGFTVTNGVLSGAGSIGGGLLCSGGAVVRDCVITGNGADYGGGVFVLSGAGAVLSNCLIRANRTVGHHGAGAYLQGTGILRRCVVEWNEATSAPGQGGGIYCESGGLIESTLIRWNADSGSSFGAGVYIVGTGAVVRSTTIAGNFGQGLYLAGTGLVEGAILYENTGGNWGRSGTIVPVVSYSCTTPSIAGAGNTTNPPCFLDSAAGDHRLATNSPCLDAGTNRAWMADAADLDGFPRISGERTDMGAYELTPAHYVWHFGANTWPYDTWATAAVQIPDAVAAAGSEDHVYISLDEHTPLTEIVVTQRMHIQGAGAWGGGATTTVHGAFYNHRCFTLLTNAELSDVVISDGRAAGPGGGVYMAGGATLRDCVIVGCEAQTYGGGVFLDTSGTVERCVLTGNAAVSNDGGGLYLRLGGFASSCVITGNHARKAGGVFVEGPGTIRNSLIAGNAATNEAGGQPGDGGGLLLYQPGGRVENCTVVGNVARSSGGGIHSAASGATVLNAIVYFNASLTQATSNRNAAGQWINSCTAPALGSDAVAGPPRLRDPAAGDYRLAFESPCREAGTNAAWMSGGVDLDGARRIFNDTVDIGAYEFPIVFVSKAGAHAAPFDSWARAATNVESGLGAASHAWTVLVTDGTYRAAGELILSNRVTLRSVNGPWVTALDGAHAHRVLLAYAPATVIGFAITNGYATEGAGVYLSGAGTLRQCVIRGNATPTGVGVFRGGGAVLAGGGELENCLIYSNWCYSYGGGVYLQGGRISQCTVAGNHAYYGYGGGIAFPQDGNSTVVNSIVYFNTVTTAIGTYSNWYGGAGNEVRSTCLSPTSAGPGCFDSDPQFENAEAGDFHLRTNSPCLDAGLASAAPTNDLDGTMRPLDGNRDGSPAADLGAYESLHPCADSDGNGLPDGWENAHYGLPVSGASPALDDDGDGEPNAREAVADTDPFDEKDWFRLAAIASEGTTVSVLFASSTSRVYTLECATNLAAASPWVQGGAADQRGIGGLMPMVAPSAPGALSRVRVRVP